MMPSRPLGYCAGTIAAIILAGIGAMLATVPISTQVTPTAGAGEEVILEFDLSSSGITRLTNADATIILMAMREDYGEQVDVGTILKPYPSAMPVGKLWRVVKPDIDKNASSVTVTVETRATLDGSHRLFATLVLPTGDPASPKISGGNVVVVSGGKE